MKMIRNLLFLSLMGFLWFGGDTLRADDSACLWQPAPGGWPPPGNYYDGFNFDGENYVAYCTGSSPTALESDCAEYCDGLNEAGGLCSGVTNSACYHNENGPACGYCQCSGCILIGR